MCDGAGGSSPQGSGQVMSRYEQGYRLAQDAAREAERRMREREEEEHFAPVQRMADAQVALASQAATPQYDYTAEDKIECLASLKRMIQMIPKWERTLLRNTILSPEEVSARRKMLVYPYIKQAGDLFSPDELEANADYQQLVDYIDSEIRTGRRAVSIGFEQQLKISRLFPVMPDEIGKEPKEEDPDVSKERRLNLRRIDQWLVENASLNENYSPGLSEQIIKILSMSEKERLFVYYQIEHETQSMGDDKLGRVVAEERYMPNLEAFKGRMVKKGKFWTRIPILKSLVGHSRNWELLSEAILNASKPKDERDYRYIASERESLGAQEERLQNRYYRKKFMAEATHETLGSAEEVISDDHRDGDFDMSVIPKEGEVPVEISEEIKKKLAGDLAEYLINEKERKDKYLDALAEIDELRMKLKKNPDDKEAIEAEKNAVIQRVRDIQSIDAELPDLSEYKDIFDNLTVPDILKTILPALYGTSAAGVGVAEAIPAVMGGINTRLSDALSSLVLRKPVFISFVRLSDKSASDIVTAVQCMTTADAAFRLGAVISSMVTLGKEWSSITWGEAAKQGLDILTDIGRLAIKVNASVESFANAKGTAKAFTDAVNLGKKSATKVSSTATAIGAVSVGVAGVANIYEHAELAHRRTVTTGAIELLERRRTAAQSKEEKKSTDIALQMAALNRQILKDKQVSAGFKSAEVVSTAIGVAFPPAASITTAITVGLMGVDFMIGYKKKKVRKSMIIDKFLNLDEAFAGKITETNRELIRSNVIGRMGFMSEDHCYAYICKIMAENMFQNLFYDNGRLITQDAIDHAREFGGVDVDKIDALTEQARGMGLQVKFPTTDDPSECRPQIRIIMSKLEA